MMRALILDGLIVDFAAADFPVAPALVWVDAPEGATHETHVFDGAAVVPRPPKSQAEIDAEESAATKRELAALDLASIRDIRAYIAAKADAPQTLKDREAAAVLARARVKV